jgi:Toprim-like
MVPLFLLIELMLRTKSLVSSINEVPRAWVFEHYLELAEKLNGQDVKMKSVFNHNDKTPSFFVYYARSKKKYLFKDFSTDDQGDGTELVKLMFKLTSRGESAHKIIDDYNSYVLGDPDKYSERVFSLQQKYKVSGYSLRNWTKLDQLYWTRFKIGSKLLEAYNVRPLKSYTMSKEENGTTKELTMSGNRIYGYFTKGGDLYKIYQPMARENKFIKVVDYVQGSDQLTFEKPFLVICSSLKDMMAFTKMRFNNAEVIAPDSENILIKKEIIEAYKGKYKAICTLFDNDPAGKKSMLKYHEEYQLPYVTLNLEKDLADCIEAHGISNTRIHLQPLLIKALRGESK